MALHARFTQGMERLLLVRRILGALRGVLRGPLGPSWSYSGPFWGLLGVSGTVVGPSEASLACSWAVLEPYGALLGLFGRLGWSK
eukprot:5266701-Pyramimonas_sp.AAC.1